MEVASPVSVRGIFDGRTLRHFEETWRFVRDGDAFVVELSHEARPGEPAERLQVDYTFGFEPLQQLLTARAKGRYQALPVAWDARPSADGGQRWFSLYPEEPIGPEDPLHWERLAYNWNSQCASCHSTGFAKGFDPESGRFSSEWAEIDVGCEACHGPGNDHAGRYARAQSDSAPDSSADPILDPGLEVRFESWDPNLWVREEGARIATRTLPRPLDAQVDVCASCHSRRGELAPTRAVGEAFLDGYRPSLIEPGLYFDDGQIRDEVYVWGSFQQSRMFMAGVRCSDCHDPHSLSLRRAGNALCTGCHADAAYDVPEHRGHRAGGAGTTSPAAGGTNCVDCHMPTRVYMGIDARRDHAFSIPRPLRSRALEAPSVCQTCHPDRDARWASAAVEDWRGDRVPREHWADSLVVAGEARTDAARWLEIALEPTYPPIVRGSAWARYAEEGTAAPGVVILEERLRSGSELERLGLVEVVRQLDPSLRIALLRPLLDDERRAIRIAAANALVDVPAQQWRAPDRTALARGLREYRMAQEANAERPEAQVNLGSLALRYADPVAARLAFGRALESAPYFVPAHVNLADLERLEGNGAAALDHLRRALEIEPDAALVRHALGLALYREGHAGEALSELERAAREAPQLPRLTLGWALALDAAGRRAEGLAVLEAGVDRGAADGEVFHALVALLRDEGQVARAIARAREWQRVIPGDERAASLLAELGAGR